MSAPVRIGVIGTGFGRRVVAPVFAATPGCAVVEVVSARDDEVVHALCARTDVDLVSVHSPPFRHVDHVRAALDAGHAVLCDKPFGRDATEAATMVDAAAADDRPALVNFEFRCDPARLALRELVRSGRAGELRHVAWTHVSAGSTVPLRPHGWLFDRDLGGGWLGAWGSHAVDTLRWLFGEVVAAQGRLRTDVRERPGVDGGVAVCTAEDGFTASLDLESGVTATIDTTFAAPASLAPRIVLQGTDAVIEAVGGRLTVRDREGGRETIEVPAGDGDPHLAPMRRWAEMVRDALRSGAVPADAPTFADGLACARVLDALRTPTPTPT